MALLWFVIGFLVGGGVVIGGLVLFIIGMGAGEKKANKAQPIESTDGEVK